MLRIFNDLKPFFEDCYKPLHVRKYAKITKISPPTASKLLKYYTKENLLVINKEKGYHEYKANRESKILKSLSRIYWEQKLQTLTKSINESFLAPSIILFGSLSKLEVTKDSDIDIAIIGKRMTKFDPPNRLFGRELQIFEFKDKKEINATFLPNLEKGHEMG